MSKYLVSPPNALTGSSPVGLDADLFVLADLSEAEAADLRAQGRYVADVEEPVLHLNGKVGTMAEFEVEDQEGQGRLFLFRFRLEDAAPASVAGFDLVALLAPSVGLMFQVDPDAEPPDTLDAWVALGRHALLAPSLAKVVDAGRDRTLAVWVTVPTEDGRATQRALLTTDTIAKDVDAWISVVPGTGFGPATLVTDQGATEVNLLEAKSLGLEGDDGMGGVIGVIDAGIVLSNGSRPRFLPNSVTWRTYPYSNGYDDNSDETTSVLDETGHGAVVASVLVGRLWPGAEWTWGTPPPQGLCPNAEVVFGCVGRARTATSPHAQSVAEFDDAALGSLDAKPRLVIDQVGIKTVLADLCTVGAGAPATPRGARVICLPFERSTGAGDSVYDQTCAHIDEFLHTDVGRVTVVVAAAGNISPRERYPEPIRAPGAAKNVITVAGDVGLSGSGINDLQSAKAPAGGLNGGAWSSSRSARAGAVVGYPTLSAPADAMLTYRSSSQHLVDRGNLDTFLPANTLGEKDTRASLAFQSGTSVACAIVTGLAAQLRGHLVTRFETEPSGTAQRALLIHGAATAQLAGDGPAAPQPDLSLGFGRANLDRSLRDDAGRPHHLLDAPGAAPATTFTTPIQAADGATHIDVTLAWLDPPSVAGVEAWEAPLLLQLVRQDGTETLSGSGQGPQVLRVPTSGGAPWLLRVTPLCPGRPVPPFALVLSGGVAAAPPGEAAANWGEVA